MAKIKRSIHKKTSSNIRLRCAKKEIKVSIPEDLTEIPNDICEISILLHGEKKIGKSSLFAQEDGAFFLEFDPLQPYAIRQRHIPDWKHLLAYLDLVEKNPEKIRSLIWDGVDIAYQLCFDYCCKKMVITHPNEEKDYGQSWRAIRDEFEKAILRTLNLNEKGIAARFIAHSKWEETETYEGKKIQRLVPYLTGQADEVLTGRVDAWFAYTYIGRQRVLVVEGSDRIAAGHRVDQQFKTSDGEKLEEIDMGNSPQQAYQNLLKGFNNELKNSNVDASDKTKKMKFKFKKKG